MAQLSDTSISGSLEMINGYITGSIIGSDANFTSITASSIAAETISGAVAGPASYLGKKVDNTGIIVSFPESGYYYTGDVSTAGYIAILLPTDISSAMFRFTFKVYEYQAGSSFDVTCGGYYTNGDWLLPFAYMTSQPSTSRNHDISFAKIGSRAAVIVRTIESWSYTTIVVTEVIQNGLALNETVDTWNSGFEATITGSLDEFTTVQTVTNPSITLSTVGIVEKASAFDHTGGNVANEDSFIIHDIGSGKPKRILASNISLSAFNNDAGFGIGDVTAAGNNAFTGTNTFNANYITGSITGSDAKFGSITGTLQGNSLTATALEDMNISQFTNDSGYLTSSTATAITIQQDYSQTFFEDFSSFANGSTVNTADLLAFPNSGISLTVKTRQADIVGKKYIVYNSVYAGATTPVERYVKYKNAFSGSNRFIVTALKNNNFTADYDISGLNLDAPEAGKDLVFQYSFDNVNWTNHSNILTGSNTTGTGTTEVTESILLNFTSSYYVRYFQGQHIGGANDNYAITDLTVESLEVSANEQYFALIPSSSGQVSLYSDSNLTYNASTSTLKASVFSGSLQGNASTVTNGIYTTNISSYATTAVTAGVGLSGGGTVGPLTLDLDFSELTDKTTDITGTTEFILQDGTTESRKAASEIKLSVFNNDAGFVTTTGNNTFTGTNTFGTIRANLHVDGTTITASTYSVTSADFGKTILFNSSSTQTVTFPSGLATGFNLTMIQIGTGTITVQTNGGVTLVNRNSHNSSSGQYASISVIVLNSSTYILIGDTA